MCCKFGVRDLASLVLGYDGVTWRFTAAETLNLKPFIGSSSQIIPLSHSDIHLPEHITIKPSGPVQGSVRPPGSKSITNRAFVCAALASGTSHLRGALDSEDTRVMADSLGQLGFRITTDHSSDRFEVVGCAGRLPSSSSDLFVANSGTTVRFLTALVTLGHGDYHLDGVPRMRERPIGDLLHALNQLGTSTSSEQETGCPPVFVRANGLTGGTATVRGDISSQFLSALLMVGPCAQSDVVIRVEGPLVSKPYVEMTLAVMQRFGVEVIHDDLLEFRFGEGLRYQACSYDIEPDASAASYFWAAAAITQGSVLVKGLSFKAIQGDVQFCECLAQMGCHVEQRPDGIQVTGCPLRGVDVDLNEISDTVLTLAAVALFASSPTTIRGVGHIRHKETDRISDLARELRKLGAGVDEFPDGLRITPGPLQVATVETYDDHRMAMSLAMVGLGRPGVTIANPGCTAKTYPRFFEDLDRLTHSRSVTNDQ